MDEWIKHARKLDEQEEAQRRKEQQEAKSLTSEMRESEKDWIDRVHKRLQEVREHKIILKIERSANGLILSHRGVADIDHVGPMNFKVRFHDVFPPSNLILSHPITVHHHRIVRLRTMSDHNIEEVLKFVSLGMDGYTEIAHHERIERNLEQVLDSSNQEEHVKGEFKGKKI